MSPAEELDLDAIPPEIEEALSPPKRRILALLRELESKEKEGAGRD